MGRRLGQLVVTGAFALTLGIASPQPVLACSCMLPEPIAANVGDPLKVVFAGTVRRSGAGGVDIAVEEWFQGGNAAVVSFSGDPNGPGFGPNGAGCQESYPPLGSRWLYVAFIPRPGDEPQINLCTTKARLDTPEGVAMLEEARAAFGSGTTPAPADPPPPAAPGDGPGIAAVVGGMAAAVLLLFGAVAVLARRSGARS